MLRLEISYVVVFFNFQERRIVTSPCKKQNGEVQRTVNIECSKSSCDFFPTQVFGENTNIFTCYDDITTCGEGNFFFRTFLVSYFEL